MLQSTEPQRVRHDLAATNTKSITNEQNWRPLLAPWFSSLVKWEREKPVFTEFQHATLQMQGTETCKGYSQRQVWHGY